MLRNGETDDDDSYEDDEDWYDDDDDTDDTASCPECGAAVYRLANQCPACGYWFSESDQRAMSPGMSKPLWMKITAWIVLAAFLISAIGLAALFF
jgi:predicted amidophosphoribosyltransferase